jgi:malonate transporter
MPPCQQVDSMIAAVLLALGPIALLIAGGVGLRRTGLLADSFWPQAERLGYYVLLPALFVHGLATANLDGVPVASLAAVLVVSTIAVAGLLVAVQPRLGLDGADFTSVFQGGVRFNNYVGVTAASGLFGAQGIALAAVANAAIVPTVNILCVLIFARYGTLGRPRPRVILRQLAVNPLVLASASGIALKACGIAVPPVIEPTLRALGAASLPLGLLCVGAALDLGTARSWVKPVLVSSLAKFGAMPAATALACLALGLHGPAAATALLFQSLPTASSAYITATQTILAGLVIPLVLAGLLALVT